LARCQRERCIPMQRPTMYLCAHTHCKHLVLVVEVDEELTRHHCEAHERHERVERQRGPSSHPAAAPAEQSRARHTNAGQFWLPGSGPVRLTRPVPAAATAPRRAGGAVPAAVLATSTPTRRLTRRAPAPKGHLISSQPHATTRPQPLATTLSMPVSIRE
jgi:hypothetical protein